MNWKMIFIISIIALIGVYFVFGNTQVLTNHENYVFQNKLRKLIKSGAKEFKLADMTDFEWDKACFYINYDYKTGELDKNSSTWPIDFSYLGKDVKNFKIKYLVTGLKPYTEAEVFFCYGRGKSLEIKNNFIYLDREGVIK